MIINVVLYGPEGICDFCMTQTLSQCTGPRLKSFHGLKKHSLYTLQYSRWLFAPLQLVYDPAINTDKKKEKNRQHGTQFMFHKSF